jgi:hypothetical protein
MHHEIQEGQGTRADHLFYKLEGCLSGSHLLK